VDPTQLVFGIALVVVLVALAGYYAWRQVQTLRGLRGAEGPPEDRLYGRALAYRRLVCSGLMLVFAAMLVGAFFLQERAAEVGRQGEEAQARGQEIQLDPEQRSFVHFFGTYWIIALLVLLAIVGLAAADLWAIRRFGLRQHRKIQAERRAMIERQVARLRRERNGHS